MNETLLFYVFGAVAIAASLLVIGQRNPIHSVLLLIASFGALSGLYVLLDAPFVAVIQIIVYAGAIMVLFLFVVMLLNAPHEETNRDERVHPLLRQGTMRFGGVLAVEIMLNAVNLTFVEFGRALGSVDGQIIVFFVMTVAAAEGAVGLAIIIALFRHRESLNPESFTALKW